MTQAALNPHRNAGRPRANGLKASLDTRRDILDAAATLFVRRGFAGASTQAIAAAAGLRQPTLFHYFKTKEAILEELYMASLSEPLAAFERIEALNAPAPVRLYAAIHADTAFLSRTAPATKAIFLLPELAQPRFAAIRAARESLIETYAQLIALGIETGDFRPGDPRLLARLVMSLDETPIDIAAGQMPVDAALQACLVADFALSALLADPHHLAIIRETGLGLVQS